MLADQLEILIFTYNRAAQLRGTLESLAAGPFADCRVTVLDNHSADETAAVCGEMAGAFADLRVVRHARNIGGARNYLRAVEIAELPYAWILADDDVLDFSDCDDVTTAIEEGEVDLISVGAPGREGWPAGRTTLGALDRAGAGVMLVLTFVSNTIYRTSLYDDEAFAEGYRLIDHLYPQFPFLRAQLERDASIVVSRHDLVRRGGMDVAGSEFFWFLCWVRCSATIPDRAQRQRTIASAGVSPRDWMRRRATSLALEKLYFPNRAPREALELLVLLRGRQRLGFLLVAPLALVPTRVYVALKSVVKRLQRASDDGSTGPQGAHSLSARP